MVITILINETETTNLVINAVGDRIWRDSVSLHCGVNANGHSWLIVLSTQVNEDAAADLKRNKL
jgi:hypothetical protein